MKHSLLITVVLTLFAGISTQAQVNIGIIGGLNFANANQKNIEISDIKKKTTLGIGAVADIAVFDNFSIQIEPMYIQKGVVMTPIGVDESDYTLSLTYIELPILIKYSYGSTFRPYAVAGAAVSLNLSSELETNFEGVTFTGDLKNVSEKLEYSLTFGGGISYFFDPVTIFIEGRYSFTLNDLIKTGEYQLTSGQYSLPAEVEDNVEFKNKGLQIFAGITIPFSIL